MPAGAPRAGAASCFPLEAGFAWSYAVDTGTGVDTLAIARVVGGDCARASVSTNGGEAVVYERRSDGVFLPDDGVYLLRDPLELGASWPSRGGRVATIIGADETVETPAGAFSGCVTVEERGGDEARIVRTTFCPGIGPVRVESIFLSQHGGAPLRVLAELRGYATGEDAAAGE